MKVKGDPEEIEDVLDKLRAQIGRPDADILVTETEGDEIVIGPNEDYAPTSSRTATWATPRSSRTSCARPTMPTSVFFVNFDARRRWLVELAGDDQEAADNLEPLRARHERLGRGRRLARRAADHDRLTQRVRPGRPGPRSPR